MKRPAFYEVQIPVLAGDTSQDTSQNGSCMTYPKTQSTNRAPRRRVPPEGCGRGPRKARAAARAAEQQLTFLDHEEDEKDHERHDDGEDAHALHEAGARLLAWTIEILKNKIIPIKIIELININKGFLL